MTVLVLMAMWGCYAVFAIVGFRAFRVVDASGALTRKCISVFGFVSLSWFTSLVLISPRPAWANILAICGLAAATALFLAAVRASRERGFHFAGSRVASSELLREGVYRTIRHPVYSAYALAWISMCVLAVEIWQRVISVPLVCCWCAFYVITARTEERMLQASAANYGDYRAHTGMFFPKF